jgi:protein SCO1/2/putative membrane protein
MIPAFLLFAALPVYNTVPEFRLTAENGRPFGSRDLAGKVWVVNFIFTNCMGPCPRMTNEMRKVQDAISPKADVRFISFTVDPERDTPEVLAAYGKRFRADPARWHFLTGPMPALHKLKREAFMLGDVTGNLEHTTRFALVDRDMRVRGYYDTAEDIVLTRLIEDAQRLASGPLPAVNAVLNATATLLLLAGFGLIRTGRREAHKKVMLAAFAVSVLFLISYLVYHFQAGSVRFQKTGGIRTVYFGVLLTHTVLAAAIPVLALMTLFRAWKGRFESHKRIARWTLPVWIYVSLTGVAVYLMLYQL